MIIRNQSMNETVMQILFYDMNQLAFYYFYTIPSQSTLDLDIVDYQNIVINGLKINSRIGALQNGKLGNIFLENPQIKTFIKYNPAYRYDITNDAVYVNDSLNVSEPSTNLGNSISPDSCKGFMTKSNLLTCILNLLFSQSALYGPITLSGCKTGGFTVSNPPSSIDAASIPFGQAGFTPSSDSISLENSNSFWDSINLGNFSLELNKTVFKIISATGQGVCSNLFAEVSPGNLTVSNISISQLTGSSANITPCSSITSDSNCSIQCASTSCDAEFPQLIGISFPNLTINADFSGTGQLKMGFCGFSNILLDCIDNPSSGPCPFAQITTASKNFNGSLSLLQPLTINLIRDQKNGPVSVVCSTAATPSVSVSINNEQKDISDVVLQEISNLVALLLDPILTLIITSITGTI